MAPAFAEKGVESGVLQKIEALKPSKKNWSKDGDALKKMLADYLSVAIKDIKARLGKMTDIASPGYPKPPSTQLGKMCDY